jgi:hypothetical protein
MKKALLLSMAFIQAGLFCIAQNVGIGTTTPAVKLHIVGGTEATLGGGGFLQLGVSSGDNIALDSLGIQGRTNGTASPLWVQFYGGNVAIGAPIGGPRVRLHIVGGSDAGLLGGGYLQLGNSSGDNVVFDNNEIEARNNNNASPLYLQADGGNLGIGINTPPLTKVDINGQLTIRGGAPGAGKVLVSDANGTATWQNISLNGFEVSAQAQTFEPTGTMNLINIGTENYDDGGHFDTNTEFYTCPIAGFYHFDVSLGANTPNIFEGEPRMSLTLAKNGLGYSGVENPIKYSLFGRHTLSFGINTFCNAGDQIGIYVHHNAFTPIEVRARFSGHRVY